MNTTRWLCSLIASCTASTIILSGMPTSAIEPATIAVNQQATKITESQIRKILTEMQTAARNQDVEGILKYMAPNITIDVNVRSGANSQTIRLTREQYRQYLEQGFGMTKSHSSQMSGLKIQIAKNGTATATYTLTEESTLKSQPVTLTSVSNNVAVFQLVKGQILETAIKSTSRLQIKQP